MEEAKKAVIRTVFFDVKNNVHSEVHNYMLYMLKHMLKLCRSNLKVRIRIDTIQK